MGRLRSIVRVVTGDELEQQIGSAHQCLAFRITRGWREVGNVSFFLDKRLLRLALNSMFVVDVALISTLETIAYCVTL